MRNLLPFPFVEAMCNYFVDACYLRYQNAARWSDQSLVITSSSQRLHDEQTANIGVYSV